MTPLELKIALHYYCGGDDYKEGPDAWLDIEQSIISKFVRDGLLDVNHNPGMLVPHYKSTPRLQYYCRFLCNIPLPEATWKIPSAPQDDYQWTLGRNPE